MSGLCSRLTSALASTLQVCVSDGPLKAGSVKLQREVTANGVVEM
eukprot:gene4533-4780_t